ERKLRERARSILEKTSPADATSMPEQDLKLIVEELETFRIELDLQSEELQKRNEEFLASEK
ncbi:MAG: hypothetical protein GWN77_00885, partial [Gammaproteobacteria bacterium]|nr:hypothetical protein [Gammaproteobacteria bacterium]